VKAMNYITSGHELHHLSGATPTSSILVACHLGKKVRFHRNVPIWSMFTTLGVQEGAFKLYTQQTCLTTVPNFHPAGRKCFLPLEKLTSSYIHDCDLHILPHPTQLH